jgi:hypothetical protein
MKEQPYIYPILYSFVKLIGFHFSLLIVDCLLARICLRTALYLASFPKQSRSLCLRWSPRAIHSRQKHPSQHPQHAPLHKELQTRHWAAGNGRNLRKTVRWEGLDPFTSPSGFNIRLQHQPWLLATSEKEMAKAARALLSVLVIVKVRRAGIGQSCLLKDDTGMKPPSGLSTHLKTGRLFCRSGHELSVKLRKDASAQTQAAAPLPYRPHVRAPQRAARRCSPVPWLLQS